MPTPRPSSTGPFLQKSPSLPTASNLSSHLLLCPLVPVTPHPCSTSPFQGPFPPPAPPFSVTHLSPSPSKASSLLSAPRCLIPPPLSSVTSVPDVSPPPCPHLVPATSVLSLHWPLLVLVRTTSHLSPILSLSPTNLLHNHCPQTSAHLAYHLSLILSPSRQCPLFVSTLLPTISIHLPPLALNSHHPHYLLLQLVPIASSPSCPHHPNAPNFSLSPQRTPFSLPPQPCYSSHQLSSVICVPPFVHSRPLASTLHHPHSSPHLVPITPVPPSRPPLPPLPPKRAPTLCPSPSPFPLANPHQIPALPLTDRPLRQPMGAAVLCTPPCPPPPSAGGVGP